jgi:N-acetylglucosaminyldiphosphoundecaprenol N-acetyl-beta-D-mannosaminyltransferase
MNNTQNRVEILGCPVDNLDRAQTLARAQELIATRRPHQHVVMNADKILKARRDEKLREIIRHCDIINADGMSLVWVSKIFGCPLKERVTGIDLMEDLIRMAAEKGQRLYFLGAREQVLARVIDIYREKYPALQIAGARNGYWTQEEEAAVVGNIKSSRADILFMAISSPRKELFLSRYLNEMGVPFVMGVGGSFDVVAGLVKRAPVWMQNNGLEWFYRFQQEPRRLWKRYLWGNTRFLGLVVKEWFKLKIVRRSRE